VSILGGEGDIGTDLIRKIYSVLLISAIGKDNWAGTRVKAVLNRVIRDLDVRNITVQTSESKCSRQRENTQCLDPKAEMYLTWKSCREAFEEE